MLCAVLHYNACALTSQIACSIYSTLFYMSYITASVRGILVQYILKTLIFNGSLTMLDEPVRTSTILHCTKIFTIVVQEANKLKEYL